MEADPTGRRPRRQAVPWQQGATEHQPVLGRRAQGSARNRWGLLEEVGRSGTFPSPPGL